jgi:hypothetical protein
MLAGGVPNTWSLALRAPGRRPVIRLAMPCLVPGRKSARSMCDGPPSSSQDKNACHPAEYRGISQPVDFMLMSLLLLGLALLATAQEAHVHGKPAVRLILCEVGRPGRRFRRDHPPTAQTPTPPRFSRFFKVFGKFQKYSRL